MPSNVRSQKSRGRNFNRINEINNFIILYFNIKKGILRCDNLIRQTQNIDVYPFEINLDGVRFFESRPNHFRLVTHNGITGIDIEKTLLVLGDMLK